MPKYDYDLFVIGGGSGGIRSARWSASLGAKVAVCESFRLGGTCVIRGCVPKKFMFYGSEFSKHFQRAKSYGWLVEDPKLNWTRFNEVRDKEISRLEGIYKNLLEKSEVNFLKGKGKLVDAHTVQVGEQTYTSRYILLAVGAWPHFLDIPGSKLACSSNEVFSLKEKPESLLILGSGYIGVEFASIFQGLGSKVQLMFRKDKILRGFDEDIRSHLQEELVKKGIKILAGLSPVKLESKQAGVQVTDDKGGTHQASQVLMATGRRACVQDLNLESVGLKTSSAGTIPVDKNFETSCKGVFALGDCADTPYELTPVATAEAMIFSENLFSKAGRKMDYRNIPTAIFTQPTVGTVGLSEEQAREQGHKVQVFTSRFRPLKLSLTSDTEKTYMKLVVCKESDKVLGCHLVGEGADEILQGFAVALQGGMTKKQFDSTIGIHPTSAEELVTMRTPRDS